MKPVYNPATHAIEFVDQPSEREVRRQANAMARRMDAEEIQRRTGCTMREAYGELDKPSETPDENLF